VAKVTVTMGAMAMAMAEGGARVMRPAMATDTAEVGEPATDTVTELGRGDLGGR
jgi:hypothetical protein